MKQQFTSLILASTFSLHLQFCATHQSYPTKPYLSRIGHGDRRIDDQHVANILQSGSISLQVLKSESSAQEGLNVLGLPVNSVPHTPTSCSRTQVESSTTAW